LRYLRIMNRQIWMIFMVITNSIAGVCQLSEDFSSSGSLNTSVWQGDLEDFTIADGVLRLDVVGEGQSVILTPIDWVDNYEMEIWFRMAFAPSLQNMLTIYLWSQSTDLIEGDAIYIQIGKSGNNDEIELYERIDGIARLIGSGQMAKVASDPAIARLLFNIENNWLSMKVDYSGTTLLEPEIEVLINERLTGPGFMGIVCDYTSTRSDKFYFDDIYLGPVRIDKMPPHVEMVEYDSKKLEVIFSELLAQDESILDYFELTPSDIAPRSATFNDTRTSVSLTFEQELSPEVEYELTINGVRDVAGNALDTVIGFLVPYMPSVGDLVINEILFNPLGQGADYIEIINNTEKVILLRNLVLSNVEKADSEVIVAPDQILPHQLLVFTEDKANIIEGYSKHDAEVIYQQKIPAMNNDEGNMTLLYGDLILDRLDYNENYHDQLLDNVDGVSLERISAKNSSNTKENWTSALASVGYGTPGMINSNVDQGISQIEVLLKSKNFSPNGDGLKDHLIIDYTIPSDAYYGSVKIFNDAGAMVRVLHSNERISGQGQWLWDGRTDSSMQAPIGIYVIYIDLYNTNGIRSIKKLTAVLADFIN
jgi:hypothetical protein